MKSGRDVAIYRGDIWEFTSNNGRIVRHVRSVACGVVTYTCNGHFRQCQLATFQRWTYGAERIGSECWDKIGADGPTA